ncbi:MAG: zinc ribbon domain-containing protein [Ktedonobacteraceae bacterium]|nr:zinc ribbon domain-containing protein [Ktedonobacteraceae bacterium]MBO0795357.1 zinc ribbon domain-containing protein [Ktedonobacteraceae bacterium]
MPVVKCPDCGFRILHPDQSSVCPNCGYPLQVAQGPITINVDNAIPSESTSPSLPVIYVDATGSQSSRRSSRRDSFSDADDNPGIPPNPFSGFVSQDAFDDDNASQHATNETANSPSDTPLWRPSNSFLAMLGLQRAPDVEGTVIQIQAQEEPPQPGIAGSIGRIFLDIFWSLPNVPMQPDKDKIRVTTARIRSGNGAQRDIRIEGHFTGVNMSLGDIVSLWGFKRKGLLIFTKGFNHTSQGPILTTTSAQARQGFLIFVLVIAAVVYLAFSVGWLHWPLWK